MFKSISINVGDTSLIAHGHYDGPVIKDAKFEISKPDPEDGYCEVSFKFKIPAGDRWCLNTSHGCGKDRETFGVCKENTHQEKPEDVISKANEFVAFDEKQSELEPVILRPNFN